MAQFTDEHKKEQSSNFFPEGIHKVKIVAVEFGTTDSDKEYAEFNVVDDDGREGSARMWFTTDAAIGFSFNVIRGIFVHNAPEGQKDKMRDKIDKLADTEALAKACEMLAGKECWYQVVQEGSYINGQGDTKPSYNRNVFGYEPSPRKAVDTGAPAPDNTDPIKIENAPDVFAF